MYKPNIFIGSSKEGQAVAEKVQKSLSRIAKCQLWNKGFFDINLSTLDNLYKKLIGFDFAIFIGSKDDWTISRKKSFDTMRDNVIFEYGLFTGGVGLRRTYCIFEDGVKLPSDLTGITSFFFDSDSQLQEICKEIKKLISDEVAVSRISMLPSTASAIAYYENFVKPVCRAISEGKTIKIQERHQAYEKALLNIVIPSELKEDLKSYSKFYYDDNKLVKGTVDTYPREYPVCFSSLADEVLQIYDMPTVLNSSYIAINLFVGKDYIGEKQDMEVYQSKELKNFQITLQNLIDGEPITKRYTTIKGEEEI